MSIRHTEDLICPLCEIKLEQAHPTIAQWFRLVKKKFLDAHVSWTFRDQESQDRAFAEKKSRVKWPNSRHNVTLKGGRPCAEAMDLFRIGPDKVARWETEFFKSVAKYLEEMGAPIVWGGSWKNFKDMPHFELKKPVK